MTAPPKTARFGLGTYLAIAFTLLSILLTGILTVVSERTASAQVRSSIGTNLAERANQTSSRMDRAMFERYREVQALAVRLGGEADMAQAQRELEALQASYPFYAWVGLADSAGVVRASTGGLLKGASVAQRPWFSNAQQGVNLGDLCRLPGTEFGGFAVDAIQRKDNGGGGGGGGDDAIEAADADFLERGRDFFVDEAMEAVHVVEPRGVMGQEHLLQAHGAERFGKRGLHASVLAHDDFGAAATDIDRKSVV